MEDRNLSNVYIGVIKDVVSKVSEDFVNSEAGEEVLDELQAIWKEKMLQSGVISNKPPSRRSITPFVHSVDDQNTPYEGLTEKYETAAEILSPPTSLQTPMPTSLHSDQGTYNLGTGQSNYMLSPISDCKNSPNDEIWRHNSYMQHSLLTNKQQALVVDVNVVHEENHDHEDIGDSNQPLAQDFFMMASRKRKRYDNPAPVSLGCQMLEQDGSGDVTIEFILPKSIQFNKSNGTDVIPIISTKGGPEASLLPEEDHLTFADVDHNTLTDQGQWGN